MNREELLDTAKKIVSGDRQRDYGELRNNFDACAALWKAWLNSRFGVEIDIEAEDVAVMNIMIKIARLGNNIVYQDGWLDIAGYAALGSELIEDSK